MNPKEESRRQVHTALSIYKKHIRQYLPRLAPFYPLGLPPAMADTISPVTVGLRDSERALRRFGDWLARKIFRCQITLADAYPCFTRRIWASSSNARPRLWNKFPPPLHGSDSGSNKIKS